MAALALSAALGSAASGATVPNVNWVALLPALPSNLEPQPGPVPHCRKPTIKCVSTAARLLREHRDRFGCDHRGVFATTYLTLTRVFRTLMREEPELIKYKRYLYWEDMLFADVYFRTVRAWDAGKDVPDAWRIAFEVAESGEHNAAVDMLLGINAHVQNDMPFVLAALGLSKPSGESRKRDHDIVNETLNRAYEAVVAEVAKRYDPSVSTINSPLHPVDDIAGLEMVRGWRETVWRNAERLVNAETDEERAEVAQSIEDYAAGWAQTFAALEQPDYRATRDAYCEEQLNPPAMARR